MGFNPKAWTQVKLRILPYILSAVNSVERFVSDKKEDSAVQMVKDTLAAAEAGADKDLLNDAAVEDAARAVVKAVVAFQNIVAAKKATNAQ